MSITAARKHLQKELAFLEQRAERIEAAIAVLGSSRKGSVRRKRQKRALARRPAAKS